jgi:hypothetical protein
VKDIDAVELNFEPFVTIAGCVSSTDMNSLTFDIDADSWSNIIHATGKFPAHISVPDHPRWGANGENKPRPTLGTFIAITGILKSTVRTENNQEIDHFCVNMDNIAYLGRATAPTKRKGRTSYTSHSTFSPNVNSTDPKWSTPKNQIQLQ